MPAASNARRRRDGYLIGTRPAFNLIVAAMSGRRLIAVGQEHLHLRAHGRVLRRAIRRRYPRLDCLGVLTEQDRRDYEALLRGRARVVCIPNAVSDAYRTCVPDLSARSVIAAGRVVRQKGFDLLVAAFADVASTHPDWSLRIYGAAGNQRGAIAAQVRSTGLGDRIVLAPPADRLDREMATASIFALSSRWEGFALTLLDAMSAGLAVVAYDCPTGPRDLIAHGVNGLLVSGADVDALAAALHRLIENPELRASCAAQARQTVQRYRLQAVGRQWDDTPAPPRGAATRAASCLGLIPRLRARLCATRAHRNCPVPRFPSGPVDRWRQPEHSLRRASWRATGPTRSSGRIVCASHQNARAACPGSPC
jgi:glycosyltransferase involved in cell wall biosynthesis